MLRPLLLLFFTLSFGGVFGQFTNRTDYDVKAAPSNKFEKLCARTRNNLAALPFDVRFTSTTKGDSVFLLFNEASVFWNFFQSKKDGFAIDLVSSEQFTTCDKINRLSSSYIHKGYLLPPVYRDDIKKNARVQSKNFVKVFAGMVPKSLNAKQVEANYMLIQDQLQCSYTTIVNVDEHGWGLLPTGLYYDTLAREKASERFKDLSKTLRFTIPFNKNTSVYKKEDIQPLYDSLRLTDYEITSIQIRSFTSVEGTLQRNLALQQERAQSIVSALQTFQPEMIQSQISSNENWVEFIEAIDGTPFDYLKDLSKDEIKEALRDPKVATSLEPVLSQQRKALIELKLEKRVTYIKSTGPELKKYFDDNIAARNIDEAMYLQEIIFHKIAREELPPSFLTELEVPKNIDGAAGLLNNNIAFRYEYDQHNTLEALQAFNKLDALLGANPKIRYNICALELKAMVETRSLRDLPAVQKKIEDLRKMGIPKMLLTRLLVNFSIVRAEAAYWERKPAERDAALKFLLDTYSRVPMSDQDLVSLCKFLSRHSRYDWAEKVLEPRIKALDASEELLFFYASLTIGFQKITSNEEYRLFLLNLVNSNQPRFCQLFAPISQGGVSFQLLSEAFLKKTYCESCNPKP